LFLQDNGRFVERANFGIRNRTGETYCTNLNLTGKFKTDPLEHTLLAGWNYNYFQNQFSYPTAEPSPPIDIFNPTYVGNLGLLPTNDLDRGDLGGLWYGFYLQDQVNLPFNVHLLAGNIPLSSFVITRFTQCITTLAFLRLFFSKSLKAIKITKSKNFFYIWSYYLLIIK
jgi:hypothetical protein